MVYIHHGRGGKLTKIHIAGTIFTRVSVKGNRISLSYDNGIHRRIEFTGPEGIPSALFIDDGDLVVPSGYEHLAEELEHVIERQIGIERR